MRALRQRALEAVQPLPVVPARQALIVRVTHLVKIFRGRRGRSIHALNDVSIEVAAGESVGLVGESGSGKTTLGRCLVGLETPTQGTIEIAGTAWTDFGGLSRDQRTTLRRAVQMVFQDPYATLNPRHSVRRTLAEALRIAGAARGPEAEARIRALLRDVGLPEDFVDRHPASLSGGERQRVAIARSLAIEPKMLYATRLYRRSMFRCKRRS